MDNFLDSLQILCHIHSRRVLHASVTYNSFVAQSFAVVCAAGSAHLRRSRASAEEAVEAGYQRGQVVRETAGARAGMTNLKRARV
eukprot:6200707-Pleurochrysis_carterae.AAC.1